MSLHPVKRTIKIKHHIWRPHGKGEVRWLLLPPAPRFVARRKMADLEEQLSDEEKVGAAAVKSRADGTES